MAAELSKDFVPAVIAWYYKGGTTIPLLVLFLLVYTQDPKLWFQIKKRRKNLMRILRIRGAVFIKEDLVELVGAWKACYKRWKDEERKV